MKKIIGFLFLAIFAVTLTGCGKGNTVTCSFDGSSLGLDGKVEMTASFDSKDEFKNASVTIILNDSTTAKATCEAMKSYVSGVKCSGKKIIFDNYADFAGSDNAYKGVTKAEFKEAMAEEGVTCK